MVDCTVLRVMPRVRPTLAWVAFTSLGPTSHTCAMMAASSSPSTPGRQRARRGAFDLAVIPGIWTAGNRLSIGIGAGSDLRSSRPADARSGLLPKRARRSCRLPSRGEELLTARYGRVDAKRELGLARAWRASCLGAACSLLPGCLLLGHATLARSRIARCATLEI